MQQDTQPASRYSGLAIVSLLLPFVGPRLASPILRIAPSVGIILLPLSYLAALVLAIVALMQIRRSHGLLRGTGVAIAGLCVSVLLPLMLYPVFARARESARKVGCTDNVERISLAMHAFASETGTYPKATTWCDDIAPYLESPRDFVCWSVPGYECGYAYNAALSGAPAKSVTPDTVVIFESDVGWNASGSPQAMMPAKPRHLRGDVFGYADGSAHWRPRLGSPSSATGAKPSGGARPSPTRRGSAARGGSDAESP
jgi:hypothetical protein